ncbi:leucine-rich_repeat domain-containing protein [Hexamita inflata]|uniref:Leucine-rich repeat domain-containing protein n=1 Tax=Hexamita inflata TaxID=28002 RepID=A0AA86TJP8_9EUKA|nr:leucine-rich repeat domain-containing protein [Hexamita inflata]
MQNQTDFEQNYKETIEKYSKSVNSGSLTLYDDISLKSLQFLEHLNVHNILIWACDKAEFSTIPLNITQLTVNVCKSVEVSDLQHMTQLILLQIMSSPLKDCQPLKRFVNITRLSLIDTKLENVDGLKGLLKLNDLVIHQNNVNDINSLQYLTNLTKLNLSQNNIIDISALRHLTNIQELYLNQNQIIHINALTTFSKLKSLELFNNYVQDIQPISKHLNFDKYRIGVQQMPSQNHSLLANKIQVIHKINSLDIQKIKQQQLKKEVVVRQSVHSTIQKMKNCNLDFSCQISNLFQLLFTNGSQ